MFFDPEKNEGSISSAAARTSTRKSFEQSAIRPRDSVKIGLRMLRAVRFATVLDYKIDNETWTALLASAEVDQ